MQNLGQETETLEFKKTTGEIKEGMKDLKRYKTVNKIKQFNFQINRVLTYGADACDEELVTKRLSKVSTL